MSAQTHVVTSSSSSRPDHVDQTGGSDFVRPFDASKDEKILKMLVGQGIMEGLARANNRFLTHPIVLISILTLGLAIDHLLSFSPPTLSNPLSFLPLLIGPCLVLLPTLGIVEYLHRPTFTSLMRKTIGSVDLISPSVYYPTTTTSSSPSSSSGAWVFSHNEEIVGIVCVDCERGGEKLDTVLGDEEGQLAKKGLLDDILTKKDKIDDRKKIKSENGGLRKRISKSTTTSPTSTSECSRKVAHIRHLDVDTPYRGVGVGTELLTIGLDHAFKVSSTIASTPKRGKNDAAHGIEQVVVQTNPFSPDRERLFLKAGFQPIPPSEQDPLPPVGKLGVLRWRGRWLSINRVTWLSKREEIFARRPN
ncbi:hypothetical protein IAR55_004947 [Kwoniella newhampshirensis]|uniref:N-acetyltransferase domain-containing protein n=1 Tax=Kwoniella newhampshirensis TaxID=1651941 RepID=A0AAW0YIF4_9TREE